MINSSRILALVSLGYMGSMVADARTWTNDQGIEIEGELIRVRESELLLKLPDGRQVAIPLKVLSGEDVAYVREWEQAGKQHSGGDEINGSEGGDGDSAVEGANLAVKKEYRWPTQVLIPEAFFSKVVQESPSFSVYESDHFHFESSRKLTEKERSHLISSYEGALFVLSKIPFNLPLARPEKRSYIVQVFFTEDEYLKAGGKKKTRMSMTPSRLMVHLKRSSRGKPVGISGIKPIGVLSDWVSQFSGDVYWFGVGLRKYMEAVPMTKRGCELSGWGEVTSSIPRSIRRSRLSLPSLKKLMNHKGNVSKETERNQIRMQNGALIAAGYFFRMDGEGNGVRMAQYVDALQSGRENPTEILLGGRSWAELEQEMVRAWKKRGVSIRFEESDEK